MNDIENGRKKLQDALLEVCERYLENIELAPEEEISFSPRLQKKMARLLKAQKSPCRKYFNTPLKKWIAACLTVVILLGAIMSCKPIREPIVEFLTEVYEKFTEFFFGVENKGSDADFISEVNTLTYVPEGYELIDSPTLTGEDSELKTVWRDNDGNEIIFWQMNLIGKTTIDTENSEVKILDNGIKIFIILKDEKICVFFNTDRYAYLLEVMNLEEDECIKIIEKFLQ